MQKMVIESSKSCPLLNMELAGKIEMEKKYDIHLP